MVDLYYILWLMLYSWLITFMGCHTRLKGALERSHGVEGVERRQLLTKICFPKNADYDFCRV